MALPVPRVTLSPSLIESPVRRTQGSLAFSRCMFTKVPCIEFLSVMVTCSCRAFVGVKLDFGVLARDDWAIEEGVVLGTL